MRAPVMLMYQLDGFFQGHRKYAKSASMDEFQGDAIDASDREDDCRGYTSNATGPCGLRPSSRFTDRVVLLSPSGAIVPIDRLATTRAWSKASRRRLRRRRRRRQPQRAAAVGVRVQRVGGAAAAVVGSDGRVARRARARCDYTAPHMQSAETACAVFLEAGYTCETTWWTICGIDHPTAPSTTATRSRWRGAPTRPARSARRRNRAAARTPAARSTITCAPSTHRCTCRALVADGRGGGGGEARVVDAQLALRHAEGPRPDQRDLSPGHLHLLVRDAYDVSFFRGSKSLILSTAEHGLGGRHTGLGSVALTVAAMHRLLDLGGRRRRFLGPLNKRCDALELEVAEEEKHLRETQEMHAAMDLLQRTSFESAGGGGGSDFRASPRGRSRRRGRGALRAGGARGGGRCGGAEVAGGAAHR